MGYSPRMRGAAAPQQKGYDAWTPSNEIIDDDMSDYTFGSVILGAVRIGVSVRYRGVRLPDRAVDDGHRSEELQQDVGKPLAAIYWSRKPHL